MYECDYIHSRKNLDKLGMRECRALYIRGETDVFYMYLTNYHF